MTVEVIGPALASVELASVARGFVVLDQLVKKAQVSVFHHGRHSSGKYLIGFSGEVAEVEESYDEALQSSVTGLLDHVLLPYAHDDLRGALTGSLSAVDSDSLLLVETAHVSTAIGALDRTLKLIDASVVDLQLAAGLHGRGFFVCEASQSDVEYAQGELLNALPSEQVVQIEVIARPHPDMLVALGNPGPFKPNW